MRLALVVVHQNMVARVAQAIELRPTRVEEAPSNVKDMLVESYPFTTPGTAAVAAAVYSL